MISRSGLDNSVAESVTRFPLLAAASALLFAIALSARRAPDTKVSVRKNSAA